jgi:hypothetical protein
MSRYADSRNHLECIVDLHIQASVVVEKPRLHERLQILCSDMPGLHVVGRSWSLDVFGDRQ